MPRRAVRRGRDCAGPPARSGRGRPRSVRRAGRRAPACTRGPRSARSGARGSPESAGRRPPGGARAPRSRFASAAGRACAGSTRRAAGRRRSGEELGMVVVEAEHEAHVLDARVALGCDQNRRRRAPGGPAPARAGPRPRSCARSSPSRTSRVASPAWRPETRSEYGPRGESRAWTGSCRTSSILLTPADGVNERRNAKAAARGQTIPEHRWFRLSPMLRRVASRVSMRSRERKLRLFLEAFAPGPGDDGRRRRRHGRAVRRRLVGQLLRGALPVAGADHRRRHHRARPLSRRVPRDFGGARRRPGAAVRRRRRSTSRSRTRSSSTSPAAARASAGSSTSSAASRGASS